MILSLLFIIPITFTLNCTKEALQPQALLQQYSRQFQVLQSIKNQQLFSHNITFNTTRENYFFIYWPLMEKCLDEIGQDFQPLIDSAAPSGIGIAGYSLAAGVKIALKIGIWKTGILGLIKTSTAALFSLSTLPVALGVGTVAYMYNKHEQDKIKAKCIKIVQSFESVVKSEQLQLLKSIENSSSQKLLKFDEELNSISKKQIRIKKNLKDYENKVLYLDSTNKLQKNYFLSFKKIMGY